MGRSLPHDADLEEAILNSPVERVEGTEWDVAVIGAGPAGCASAFACAELGLRTVIIEKSAMPRDKVCGGCISPQGVRLLERMGVAQAVRRVASPLDSFVLASGGRSLRVTLSRSGVAVGRDVLDAMLLEHAKGKGAIGIVGARATLIDHDGTGCRFTVAIGDKTSTVSARCMVVADGLAGSFLPHTNEWKCAVARASYFGVGTRLSPGCGQNLCETGTIAMRCGRAGYFGAVGLSDGSIDVAAALSPERTRQLGGPGQAVREISLEAGASEAADLLAHANWRGTPLLTRKRRVEASGIFVLGDAAGYVEPFTGEGMSWGLAAGIEVARHVNAAVSGRYRAGVWTQEWNRLANRRRIACRATALALRKPALVSACIGAANGLPAARNLVELVVAGPWSRRWSEVAPS